MRAWLLGTALLCITALPLIAQDGKIRGRVVDRETREALVGANVIIEGTSLGASTDLDGEYVILGIPPGVYTVKVSFIGYSSMTVANVRVNSNLTTTQDFQLSSTAIQVQAVEVFADRPLVQRNTTNTVRMATQENIQNLPFRGIDNILALQAGVVQQDGVLYVRGGRAGEIGFYVDGANVTNPFLNAENVSVIQEAIEELQLQSGGFTAEFGGSTSGVVRTTVRTGGSKLKTTLDYQTDDFAKPGEQFLGTSSFGFRNAVLTVSGPLPFVEQVRFFVAGQHNYVRNRQQMFLEPFRFEGLVTDGFGGRPPGELLPNDGVVEFKRNYLYNNWRESNTLQGTLVYDMNPFKFRFTGSYIGNERPTGGQWPTALAQYFNQARNRMVETSTGFGNFRMTHVLGPETFYEVGIAYSDRANRTYDPTFGDDWWLYQDSIANASKGYTEFSRRFTVPLQLSTINGFRFDYPGTPTNSYSRDRQTSLSGSIDLTSQINTNFELKAGGRIESWTVRDFTVGNIARLLEYQYGIDGKQLRTFANAEERRILLRRQGAIDNFGYDVDGNESDDGFDAPREPLFASAYIQSKFEFQDLILNLGLRVEYYDTKNLRPEDPATPAFNTTLDAIDESALIETDPFFYFLPRLSFSFPATDNTVFYAQYGRYVQLPDLDRIYVGNGPLSTSISPITRSAIGGSTAFLALPERTTQFEIGIRQILSDNFAFTLSGFYKHVKDLLQHNKYPTMENPLFRTFKNEDFSTLKGLELTFELRRTNRLAANVSYTLTDAVGTGSDPTDFSVAVSDVTILSRFPVYTNPLAFNQAHRGNLILDYRFGKGDGGAVLEGMGMNLILSFNSGHPFTKIKELSELGQTDAWRVAIRTPSRRTPVEAINNSTTPWVFNIDLNFSKVFFMEGFNLELYANVLNLFDSKQIVNLYETTGSAQDDGWLTSPLSASFSNIPRYAEFYRAINLDNRWAYMNQFGRDLYGAPRQVRVGVKLEY